MSMPYPSDFDINHEAARQAARATLARQRLDPSDVLGALQHLLLAIDDDAQHPLWRLIKHCTAVGTTLETGVRPYMAEQVGEALLPVIDKAISRLLQEALDDDAAWEVA